LCYRYLQNKRTLILLLLDANEVLKAKEGEAKADQATADEEEMTEEEQAIADLTGEDGMNVSKLWVVGLRL